jgi:hypothetical protein
MPLGDWEPNRSETFLGRQSQPEFAQDILKRSSTDSSVQFVLNAVALPRTWSSMYLVFEAIATDVGGQHKLTKKGWITAAQQSDFTHAANNSRNFAEGSRHASKQPPLTKPLISLHEAYVIITQLIFHWFDSKR